jgi:hypothetical protein
VTGTASLSPVVKYHGLARRDLLPPRFLMRPLLNGGTLAGLMSERPLATPQYEKDALTRFRLDLSAEEFAARFGHQFAMFNFGRYTYRTVGMTEWVDNLAAFFFANDLAGRLRAAREKYLTNDEIARVEAFERDPF